VRRLIRYAVLVAGVIFALWAWRQMESELAEREAPCNVTRRPSPTPRSQEVVMSVEDLEVGNVEVDLARSLQNGDMRFFGVYGYSVMVPGVTNYNEAYAGTFGVKVIAGTSDFLEPGRIRLQSAATRYAMAYNRLLARHIASLPRHSAPTNAPAK